MRRAAVCGGLLAALWAAQPAPAHAAEVRSNYRTEAEGVFVDVENQSEGAIRVKSVALRFYDMGGTPMGKETHACERACDVAQGGAGAFGPFKAPEGWESVEVAEVAHEPIAAVERPAQPPPKK